MFETYSDFIIFEVKDNGEKKRLNITEDIFRQNNGSKVLHPLQVAIIIKEELRRIYIWKGISSSVRKKFIASRVASELQRKLTDSSNFHRCKIIAIDQGDEPEEFLNAFGFKEKSIPGDSEISYSLNEDSIPPKFDFQGENKQVNAKSLKKLNNNSIEFHSYKQIKKVQKSRSILDKVLKEEIPVNFKRGYILVGNNVLYSQITKKAEIFNESMEVKEWDLVSNLPKQIFELEGQKLRIYLNQEATEIEAIEILEKIQLSVNNKEKRRDVDFNIWTVKQLKQYCHENNIKIISSYRKADIVRVIREFKKMN
ncbi:MAG: hypothetical protein ACFE8B_03485 [Candidatus Hermodarchaeota archaeon]